MKDLSGKKILITGAAGGLGQEFARQLLGLGAMLVLADSQEEKLENVARELDTVFRNGHGRVLGFIVSDLSQVGGCIALYDGCMSLSGTPDMLINNAGLINYGYFHEIPEERWKTLMGVNLLAPMDLTYRFLPGMVERGDGHIVFLSSVAGFSATALGTPYSCSKFAIRGFGMSLSGELKQKGVKVTNIYPWWVKTELLKSPEYGSAKLMPLPGFLMNDPKKVVAESIEGIRKEKLHVYPGIFAKGADFFSRFVHIVAAQAR